MITREELLAAAPEGVDYAYLEEDSAKFYLHYHTPVTGWWRGEVSYESVARKEYWDLDRFIECDELPRRWAAQRESLQDWIKELGLGEEYRTELDKYLKAPEDAAVITLTPEQQEHLPQFALDFLKSKLPIQHNKDEEGSWAYLNCVDCSRYNHFELRLGSDGKYRCGRCHMFKEEPVPEAEETKWAEAIREHAEQHLNILSGTNSVSKGQGFEISQELYDDLVGGYSNPCKLIPESGCQCGAVKAKSPHSTWCPAYQR